MTKYKNCGEPEVGHMVRVRLQCIIEYIKICREDMRPLVSKKSIADGCGIADGTLHGDLMVLCAMDVLFCIQVSGEGKNIVFLYGLMSDYRLVKHKEINDRLIQWD